MSTAVYFTRPVGFKTEYFDPVAGLLKTFVLTCFPNGKLQMVHAKTGKMFLSKTHIKDLTPNELFVGGTVVVLSRELSIVDYADEGTRKYIQSLRTSAFVMVLPSAMDSLGEIIATIQGKNDQERDERKGEGGPPAAITNAKMFQLEGRKRAPNLAPLEDALPQNGRMVALEVVVNRQQGGFANLLGVVDRLRQRHGGGGVFASNTPSEATEHARWVFQDGGGMSPASDAWGYGEAAGGGAGRKSPSSAMNTPTTQACTLCVVRPHVVRDGGLGEVLSFVAERGFQVAGLQMIWLGETAAEELLRPYRGVLSCHGEAVRHLKSGPCVALRIKGGDGLVEEFREACGPADPEVARALYPDSIRARLGVREETNAVHCTDLPEDGLLECQYMFDVIAKGRQGVVFGLSLLKRSDACDVAVAPDAVTVVGLASLYERSKLDGRCRARDESLGKKFTARRFYLGHRITELKARVQADAVLIFRLRKGLLGDITELLHADDECSAGERDGMDAEAGGHLAGADALPPGASATQRNRLFSQAMSVMEVVQQQRDRDLLQLGELEDAKRVADTTKATASLATQKTVEAKVFKHMDEASRIRLRFSLLEIAAGVASMTGLKNTPEKKDPIKCAAPLNFVKFDLKF
eukprot:jgi/Undpi1/4680/HiC_scaffold_18.g08034.m1